MKDPRSVECPHCGADPGEECFTPTGAPAKADHAMRQALVNEPIVTKTGKVLTDDDVQALADEAERGYDVSKLKRDLSSKIRLPSKLKYRVRTREWVWCDSHCEIHAGSTNPYDDGDQNCRSDNWRRVYIETNDKTETF